MTGKADFYKDILDNLYDGVYFVDRLRRINYWNKGAERISGFTSEYIVGHSCSDNFLMHVDDRGVVLCKTHCPLTHTMNDGQIREAEVYLHHSDGHRVPVRIRVSPIYNEQGEIVGGVETFSDNTTLMEERERAKELKEAALYDSLTGIANRRYTESKILTNLIKCKQHGIPASIFFIDIDRFKNINDTFGHETGDKVLKMVANTLNRNIRATDFVGRWGGEEFIALISNLDETHARQIANKLVALVSRSQIIVNNSEIKVSISIGATITRPDDNLESLIHRADELLYQSKNSGRNRVTFSTSVE